MQERADRGGNIGIAGQPCAGCGQSGADGEGRTVPKCVEQCRLAHNPEVAGSNPAPATRKLKVRGLIAGHGGRALIFVAARRQQDLAPPAGQEQVKLTGNGSGDSADLCTPRVCCRCERHGAEAVRRPVCGTTSATLSGAGPSASIKIWLRHPSHDLRDTLYGTRSSLGVRRV
jgi:hypothetical protein